MKEYLQLLDLRDFCRDAENDAQLNDRVAYPHWVIMRTKCERVVSGFNLDYGHRGFSGGYTWKKCKESMEKRVDRALSEKVVPLRNEGTMGIREPALFINITLNLVNNLVKAIAEHRRRLLNRAQPH